MPVTVRVSLESSGCRYDGSENTLRTGLCRLVVEANVLRRARYAEYQVLGDWFPEEPPR